MVNKILTFSAVIVILFTACQSENTNDKPAAHDEVNNSGTQTHDHHEPATSLSLNNGAKWQADSMTEANVEALILIADNNTAISLEDYQKLAHSLEEGINKLINDCRMKGPEHEALHQWLEPLLTMNQELTEAASAEDAEKLFLKEKEHLHLFNDYFE
jgi:hypothetical protein